jgi:hypothetical protein
MAPETGGLARQLRQRPDRLGVVDRRLERSAVLFEQSRDQFMLTLETKPCALPERIESCPRFGIGEFAQHPRDAVAVLLTRLERSADTLSEFVR